MNENSILSWYFGGETARHLGPASRRILSRKCRLTLLNHKDNGKWHDATYCILSQSAALS